MSTPSDCCFSDSHEWFRIEGDIITIGITQFAANELTDITYVEMQPVSTVIAKNDSAGEVESVKTTSDIMSSFEGEIIEVNDAVTDNPSLLNSDPFGRGWLIKIRADGPVECDALMDQAEYDGKYPV